MENIKHCIIIPCSDKKADCITTAFDMYRGALNQIIKGFDKGDVFKHFHVFYLSAKLGLIEANTMIEPYNQSMSKSTNDQKSFALENKKTAQRLLKRFANKDVELYTLLSKEYKAAFDFMNLSVLKKFKLVYRGDGARGIGDHRGRLSKLIKSKLTPQSPPTLFRSGLAHDNEFAGFLQAGCAIGSSLAYTKNDRIYGYIIDAIKMNVPIFLDNGLISAVTKGVKFDPEKAIAQYIEILSSLGKSPSLSVVIPDNPFDNNEALLTIKKFKTEIKWLASRCQVILPIHKGIQRKPVEQLREIVTILGDSTARKINLGIPCREVKGNKWRLPLHDVESLFQIKDKHDKQLFSRVHYLALSEVSQGQVFAERVALSQMYNMTMTADCCRVTALFGANEGKRKGSVLAREIKQQLTVKNEEMTEYFKGYDVENEWDEPYIFDYVNELSVEAKVELWNLSFPSCKIDYDASDEFECSEVFERCVEAYTHNVVAEFKRQLGTVLFSGDYSEILTIPSNPFVREATIYELFKEDGTQRQPVQMGLAV